MYTPSCQHPSTALIDGSAHQGGPPSRSARTHPPTPYPGTTEPSHTAAATPARSHRHTGQAFTPRDHPSHVVANCTVILDYRSSLVSRFRPSTLAKIASCATTGASSHIAVANTHRSAS